MKSIKKKFWLVLSFAVTLYIYSTSVYAWTVPCCSYDSTCCKESVQLRAIIKATTSTDGKDTIIHALVEKLNLENVSMEEITSLVSDAVLGADGNDSGGETQSPTIIKQ